MVDCVIDIEPNVAAMTKQQEQRPDAPMPSHEPATVGVETHEKDKKQEDAPKPTQGADPERDKKQEDAPKLEQGDDPRTLATAAETVPQEDDEPVSATTTTAKSDTSAVATKQQIAGQLSEVLDEENPADLAKLLPDEDDATTVDPMQQGNSVASTESQHEDKSEASPKGPIWRCSVDPSQLQHQQQVWPNQGPLGLLDTCPCPGSLRPRAPAPMSVRFAATDKSG